MATELFTVPAGTKIADDGRGHFVFCEPNQPPYVVTVDISKFTPTIIKIPLEYSKFEEPDHVHNSEARFKGFREDCFLCRSDRIKGIVRTTKQVNDG